MATRCPTCAAPLDFAEGSTTVRCAHCGSRLLVTGRGQTLAFSVAPRVDAARALAVARTLAPRATDAALHFLPYYRFTAEEFRWVVPEPPPGKRSQPADPDAPEQPLELEDRHVERSFLACAFDGFGVYSLGVRAGVLRLSLFRRDALAALGRVVAADMPPTTALAQALRPLDAERIVHRAVLGGVLSLVYYPYWVVTIAEPGPERLAIVDGVAGTGVTGDAPPALRARLGQAESAPRETAELRPLVCPNCGWDLPVDAGCVVLFCTTCARAWQVAPDRLEPVPATVVAPPAEAGVPRESLRDLPVWAVGVAGDGALPARMMVPAFRYRGLRLLVALATRLTRKAPALEPGAAEGRRLEGGCVDREEAVALARFVATGLDRHRAPGLSVTGAALVWLPFAAGGGALRELQTGFALPAGGLAHAP